MTFLKNLLPFSIRLIVLFSVIAGAHYFLILQNVLPAMHPFFISHAFLFLLTLLSYTVVLTAFMRSDKAGFVFAGMSMVKMMAAVAFLFPYIKEGADGLTVFILQFMALYFIYLFMEAVVVLRLLKSSER